MDIVFTELTLNYLTVTLLAAAMSAFALFDLWKGPVQPLKISFAGLSCSTFLLAVFMLGDNLFYQKWSYLCLLPQVVFLVPIGGFVLVFAYCFPKKLKVPKWELNTVIIYISLVELNEIYQCIQRLWSAHNDSYVYWRADYSDLSITVIFVWAIIVFLRQAARSSAAQESSNVLSRIIKPSSYSKRRARNMALVFLLPAIFITQPTDFPMMSWVVLIALNLFMLLYLNESPEKTSFLVKLTGVFLCFNLLVLSVCGGVLIMEDREITLKQGFQTGIERSQILKPHQSVSFLPDNGPSAYSLKIIPETWDESVGDPCFGKNGHVGEFKKIELPFEFPFFNQRFQNAFVSLNGYVSFDSEVDLKTFRYAYGNAPLIIPALMDVGEGDLETDDGVFTFLSPEKAVISWINVPSARNPNLKHSFQLILRANGSIDFNYGSLESYQTLYYDAHYPIDTEMAGLIPNRTDAVPERIKGINSNETKPHPVGEQGIVEDHTLMLLQAGMGHGKLFAWTLLAVFVLSLIGLPLFFHHTLIRPLQSLLDGVDAVNRGKLDTKVPVVFMDEIGFLANSFNRMVKFVSRSTDQLQNYRSQLEMKVKERTKDLEVAKAEAERANDAKAVFLANMSHELRTPLHPIIGFSRLVAEGKNLTKEQLESLNIIHTSGNHLLNLISDILIVSKAEAGKDRLVETEFDLVELIDDLRGILAMQVKERNMPITWHVPPDMPIRYRSDVNKIKQILLNLISNALKFTPKGVVSVRIQWEYEDRSLFQNENDRLVKLRFIVSDTGEGIAEKDLRDLFKPFFQSPHSNRKHKGTGLGLSICKHFADMLGGSIRIESRLTFGTTVYLDVSLPTIGKKRTRPLPATPPMVEPPATLKRDPSEIRMLVAEDEPINAKLIRSMLAPSGFQLKIVSDGLQAFETTKDWKPHLIWMDIRMPVMDGRESTRIIRQYVEDESITPNPIIIALTADVNQSEKELDTLTGFDRVMIKPCSKTKLMEAISQLLPNIPD